MKIRNQLLDTLRHSGIDDSRVLAAFGRIDRALFVPENEVPSAAFDIPIPIGHGQVTTQPSLVARMVSALELKGNERVLEIGTGLGYQAAILSQLCEEVFTIEWFSDLAAQARLNLKKAGITNVHVIVGDGSRGFSGEAPFDAVILAAAGPRIPPPLRRQLKEGGTLVQPIGEGGDERVNCYRKADGQLGFKSQITLARFVPLMGIHGVEKKQMAG